MDARHLRTGESRRDRRDLTPADGGEILLQGKPVTIDSPTKAVELGISYLPEDRRRHGVILEMDNIGLDVENLIGGDGNDFVFGDNGNDVAFLGANDDVFHMTAAVTMESARAQLSAWDSHQQVTAADQRVEAKLVDLGLDGQDGTRRLEQDPLRVGAEDQLAHGGAAAEADDDEVR